MKWIILALCFLSTPLLFAQTDTPCFSSPKYYECLLAKEKASLATANAVIRKGDSLLVKIGSKKMVFLDVKFNELQQNHDSVRQYVFIKQLKGFVIIQRIARYDGNSWLLVNLTTGKSSSFESLPVFSPSMRRLMVVSGRFHNPYSPEAIYIYKPGKDGWSEEYKSDAKPLEAYGYAKWTSDNRIAIKKYDWAIQSKPDQPLETETLVIYEFNEWRKVTKKEK